MKFLLAFVCIALIGSIVAALAPKGGNEKAVKAVASLVLALSVVSMVIELSATVDWNAINTDFSQPQKNEQELARQTAIGLSVALEAQVKDLVKEFCGKEPDNVKCDVTYEEGQFQVVLVKIYIEKTEKAPLFLFLANKLELDYGVFELYEMS